MPCDQVITNSVAFESVGIVPRFLEIALRGMKATGISVTGQVGGVKNFVFTTADGYRVVVQNGKAQSQHPNLAKVMTGARVGYSTVTAKAGAQRMGWGLRQTGPNQWEMTKARA